MWLPIVAGISSAFGIFCQKSFLAHFKINRSLYETVLFLFLFILSLIAGLAFPYLYSVDPGFKDPYYIFLFIVLGLVGGAWNILFTNGLSREKISNSELILMLEPIVVILIASLILPSERSSQVLIAALIAGSALIAAHIKRHHLSFSSASRDLLVYLLLIGFEAVLIKELLSVFSPIALYTYRTFLIFLYFLLIFRPFNGHLGIKTVSSIFGLSLVGITSMVSLYYSYNQVGIVYTRLILLISPILIYASSIIFFKEKIRLRVLIAAVIIFASIFYILINS